MKLLLGPAALQFQILRIFLVLGALFGTCYALLLPPLQAPDEFAHFFRAYGIAEGTCIAPKLTGIPVNIRQMVAAFQANLEEQRRIDFSYIRPYLHMPLNDAQQEGVTNEAAGMYSCVPYLPSALGIEAGRLTGAPPAAILYLSRFANLLAYLAIVYLALRQLPRFQLPLLAVALMPMALNQAASASWDGFAYAVAFLLFAYILRLAWDPHIDPLQRKHYWMLGGVMILASFCKADVWLAPLLILVPASKFGSPRRKWLVVLGMIGLALMIISGWNYVNRNDVASWVEIIKLKQVYISENVAFLVHNPWVFFETSMRTWKVHGLDFAAEFVGRLGWLAVILPAWCIWLYFLLLGLLAFTTEPPLAPPGPRMTAGYRLVCAAVAVAAVTSTFVGMWCAETPRGHTDTVLKGIGLVLGVQGRYFIPFALPLLLAISCAAFKMDRRWLLGLVACTALAVNAAALQEIRKTYYQIGDMGPYENKLVKRNGNTPEDGKIFVVRGGRRHWIIFGSWVPKHGYRWDDLQILTPEQFNTIPEGKVIGDQ